MLFALAACSQTLPSSGENAFFEQPVDRAAVQRLSEAVRIKTISHDDPAQSDPEAFTAFRRFLSRSYPAIHRAAKRETFHNHSLLYTWQGRDPALQPIVLLAHQDVVPADAATRDLWSHPPFAGDIAEGYVWGRGALDMKGQLIGLFEALDGLARSGFRPERTILIGLGEDEESAGRGAQAIARALLKRGIRAEFVLDEGPMILNPFSLTGKPAGFIGVAEKGYGTLEIVARDKEGHSSTPPADPAVEKLARAILAVQDIKLERKIDDTLRQTLTTLSGDFDGLAGFAVRNLWAFGPLVTRQLKAKPAGAALLGSTLAPTVLEASSKENVLPEFARAVFNVRIHPRDTPDEILSAVERAIAPIDGVTVNWLGEPSLAPPVADTKSSAYRLVARHAKAIAGPGVKIAPALVFGATDSRFFRNVTDTILRFQPLVIAEDEITTIHGVNERMSFENLTRIISFYRALISEAAGGGSWSAETQIPN